MPTAGEIFLSGTNYTGNESLGGFTYAPLDTKPIEDLGKYTMLYNKSLFDQRQKDADEKILEIAKIADINVNDLRGKDKDEILKQINEAMDYASTYARQTAKNPKEKVQQYLDWQKKVQGVSNNYTSGKARSIKYQKELDAINNDATLGAATKAEMVKELDDKFDNTKISEQFGAPDKYPLTTVSIPPAITSEASVIQQGANANVDATLTTFNYKANGQLGFAIVNALPRIYPDANTPEGKTNQAKQQRTIESEAKIWQDSGEVLNSIMQKYYVTDANGNTTFDAQKFEQDNAGNKTLMGTYNALKNMDADARTKYDQSLQGRFSDKGFDFNLPPNTNPEDFKSGFVDFSKPIPAEKIVTAGIFGNFGGDNVKKAVTPTDNKIQLSAQAETARHNKAMENVDRGQLKLAQDKWHQEMTGGETVKNGAMERAKRIYEDMQKLADKNGVIAPDKLRQLNVEQLKYLGIEVPQQRDADGKITVQGGFRPLELGGDKQYAVQLINGEIKVLQPKGDSKNLEKTADGRYVGEFDNTKSTNLFNVATNVLNEELQKAGTKELNSYMPIDLGTGGVSVNTTGSTQSTTVSQSDLSQYDIPKGAKVAYSKDGKVIGYELKGQKFKF